MTVVSGFEVYIRRAVQDGTYPVTVRVMPEDRRVEGTLRLPFGDAEV